MSYKIAIASGKGGTGKTTVAVNLCYHLNKTWTDKIQLVDCDVEEPNDKLFFPKAEKINETEICQFIPQIDRDRCTWCRKCAEYCEFNAIVVIPPVKFAEVNPNLCHSCGACSIACWENAINEYPIAIGKIADYFIRDGFRLAEGRLKISSARQTMLIRELKKHISRENDIIIFDAPPGTSCPVVETVWDADYVILVTEPTLFGLHDMKLMIEILSEIQKPFGVIVNKAGLGDDSVYAYLEENGIDLLCRIPFNQDYAISYAKGRLFEKIPSEISVCFGRILHILEQRFLTHERDNCIKW